MPAPAGCLYIVATPIGNLGDITLRAMEILKNADAVICEELRQGSTLLKKLGITPHELININEHNEAEVVPNLVNRILLTNQSMALISDCGTPVFADPGRLLVEQAASMGIKVVPIPGPSSLMAALSVLDFKLERFHFAGFLARDPDERRRELTRLRGMRIPVVVMDTPYRLIALLQDVMKTFGKNHALTLAMDLTLPNETVLRGPAAEIAGQVGSRKAEFILIIHA